MNRSEPERLLTIAQAAELTSYDEATIRSWMDRGLPFIAGKDGRKRSRLVDRRIRQSVLWEWVRGLEVIKQAPLEPPVRGRVKVPAPLSGPSAGLGAWREAKKAAEGGA